MTNFELLNKIVFILIVFLISITITGCPQMIEKTISKTIPENPKEYKPIYMTQTTKFVNMLDKYKEQFKAYNLLKAKLTEGQKDSINSYLKTPLNFDVRNVDDRNYPIQIELKSFVYDSSGKFVMGLAPPYFNGLEDYKNYWISLTDSCNGNSYNIKDFQVEEVREDKREPYSISFVLDHSGSMGDTRIQNLRVSVKRILGLIKKGDYISVNQFSGETYTEVSLTDDSSKYKNEFEIDNYSINFSMNTTIINNKNKTNQNPKNKKILKGGTALYDAAIEGMNEISKAPKNCKRVLILFTDGEDNASKSRLDEVQSLAKKEDVLIYSIAYGMVDEEILKNLAEYNGGKMYRIYSNKEFAFVFADIYRRLNNYYKITYKPEPCNGLHYAIPKLSFPDFDNIVLTDTAIYDKTIFTPFDTIGSIFFANIEFEFNKSKVNDNSIIYINEIVNSMKKYPKLSLEIRGHTDDIGGDEYNLKLSTERANEVMDLLINQGISPTKLIAKGFGKTKPLNPNDNDENRKKNRRTEFVILSK